MSRLYNIGTIDVTNASATVTGTGVDWSTVNAGDLLVIDGATYAIADKTETTLTLLDPYPGATAAGIDYAIVFNAGRSVELLTAIQAYNDNLAALFGGTGTINGALTVSGQVNTAAAGRQITAQTTGGTANAVSITTGANVQTVVKGSEVLFYPTQTNTGATTLQIDGLPAAPCLNVNLTALPADYLRANVPTRGTYDGTSWVLDRMPERIDNANGKGQRWADGSQVFIADRTLTFSSADAVTNSFGYPAFVASPHVNFAVDATSITTGEPNRGILSKYIGSRATTFTVLRLEREVGGADWEAGDEVLCTAQAEGRWY